MKKRIVILSDWYLPRFGGIELYLRDLTGALKASGLDVEVITPIPGPSIVNSVRVHRLCDIDKTNGGYLFPPSSSASNFRDFLYILDLLFRPRRQTAMQRLRELLQTENYDLAHIHLGNTPFAFAATNTCLRLGLPTVATFHSTLGQGEIPLARLISKVLGCSSWPGKVHLTAVSSNVAAVRGPMLGNAPIEILPNAIEVESWRNVQTNKLQTDNNSAVRKIELLAAMRLHPRKRPGMLIQAMRKLKSRTPDGVTVRLRIAGEGPLRNGLQKFIDREHLGDSVKLCGNLEREELIGLMSEADLFVMPSVLESFGIAALEARMAGIPVLAMQNSGARDYLTPGEDSILVDSDEEFANALTRFISDAELRDKLMTGCAKPLPGYSWADLVKRCRDTYFAQIASHQK